MCVLRHPRHHRGPLGSGVPVAWPGAGHRWDRRNVRAYGRCPEPAPPFLGRAPGPGGRLSNLRRCAGPDALAGGLRHRGLDLDHPQPHPALVPVPLLGRGEQGRRLRLRGFPRDLERGGVLRVCAGADASCNRRARARAGGTDVRPAQVGASFADPVCAAADVDSLPTVGGCGFLDTLPWLSRNDAVGRHPGACGALCRDRHGNRRPRALAYCLEIEPLVPEE